MFESYGAVESVAFSSDGQVCIIGHGGWDYGLDDMYEWGNASLLNTRTGEIIQSYPSTDVDYYQDLDEIVNSVAISPDGNTFLAAFGSVIKEEKMSVIQLDRESKIFDWFATFFSKQQLVFGIPMDYFYGLPSEVEHGDGFIWDIENQSPTHVFQADDDQFLTGLFSPDSAYVVTRPSYMRWSQEDNAYISPHRMWNVETGEEVWNYVSNDGVNWVEFSPDGSLLLTWTFDSWGPSGLAILWDVAAGTVKRGLQLGGKDYVYSIYSIQMVRVF